ncbi:helix-turn-helix domain-containing protein [Thermocrispum municipale]|jgi:predicted DNA-binding transcriptional regulator AlpA|uniref:helix-turn-helix domain-containing protein n=1 Tax=Thermocrispum municipale TaxID=37926 RepID=UPI00041F4A73|nr:helix-turn-helix domain-containing protein [Thermocrispum municipale]
MTATKPSPDAEWWTTSDVAAYLGVRVATISAYRNRGQMPAPDHKIGRTQLWRPQTIIAWHERRPGSGYWR